MTKTIQLLRPLYNPQLPGNCPLSHFYTRRYVLALRTILVGKALTTIFEKKQYHVQWTLTTSAHSR